jgi:hypothetical protein
MSTSSMCCVLTKNLKRNSLMSDFLSAGFQGSHEYSGLLDMEEKLISLVKRIISSFILIPLRKTQASIT